MNRLLTYWQTGNLGDVIQTIALSRLLPQGVGIPRCRLPLLEQLHSDKLFVVNGFHRLEHEIPNDANCLFSGIHCSDSHVPWVRQSRFPAGARDPFTHEVFLRAGIPSVMLGCSTMTLPNYIGPRKGVISVDFPSGSGLQLTHRIHQSLSFNAQWRLGIEYLTLYQHAAEVHTSRLHVALPCLAMGTPVALYPTLHSSRFYAEHQRERFSVFESLGLKFGKLQQFDMNPMRDAFVAFLRRHVSEVFIGEPKIPLSEQKD